MEQKGRVGLLSPQDPLVLMCEQGLRSEGVYQAPRETAIVGNRKDTAKTISKSPDQ